MLGEHIGLGGTIAKEVGMRISHGVRSVQSQFFPRYSFDQRVYQDNIGTVKKVNQFGYPPRHIAHRFHEGTVHHLSGPCTKPTGEQAIAGNGELPDMFGDA